MSKEWPETTAEAWDVEVQNRIDALENQRLDRRIIELDDVMRNNFTRRLDELEESYKDHLDWASTHGHPDLPQQETPTEEEHDPEMLLNIMQASKDFVPEEPEGKIKLDDTNAVMTDATKRYIAKPEAEELKSCPFCGGEADSKQGINVSSVTCHACGFHFYRGTIESPETATEAWNRRAESEEVLRLRREICEVEKNNDHYFSEALKNGTLIDTQAKEIARLKEELADTQGSKDSAEMAFEWAKQAIKKVGPWLSAALEDPAVCDKMKSDIKDFFRLVPIEENNQHSARTGG